MGRLLEAVADVGREAVALPEAALAQADSAAVRVARVGSAGGVRADRGDLQRHRRCVAEPGRTDHGEDLQRHHQDVE